MSLPILLFLQAVAQQPTPPPLPPTPRREISDPGIIATDQRVTPAGLQSVFTGRVTGVRFGAHPGEIWVTVPGALYRLGWRDNAVLASTAFDGHSGVQGIAIDSVGGRSRVFVSAVGKLPAGLALSRTPGTDSVARAKSVAHLVAYGGDSVVLQLSSLALGAYIAGSPALARRPNSSGRRVEPHDHASFPRRRRGVKAR